jgi:alpha-N-arabinofuranosidase
MMNRLIALATAGLALAGSAGTPGAPAAGLPAGEKTVVTVTDSAVASVASDAIGADDPFWNPMLTRPDTAGLIRAAGLRTLSFDAGGSSDLYHFENGGWLSPDPNGPNNGPYQSLTPQFSFDQFATTAKAAHAGMLIHVNYGTGPTDTPADPSTPQHPKPGDPQEAAAWVRYANVTHHYGVRDWVIGEETYLNGWHAMPTGFPLEPDAHPDKSPAAYARNSIAFARAMKAVDPSIRVGVELVAYDPAKVNQPGPDMYGKLWDDAVLATPGLADTIDFADVHWYPSPALGSSDAAILASTATIGPALQTLRSQLDRASRPGHRLGIVVGETNSAALPTQQQVTAVGALYLLDDNLTLLENGATTVDWWALYNGPLAADDGGWGDLGLLSSGLCPVDQPATTDCEPPVGTPFAPYWTMQLLTTALKGGGRLLATATTGDGLLSAHAVRRADGTLAVILLNEDPQQARTIHLALPRGYRAVRTLGWQPGDTAVISHPGPAPTTLAPYSATVILLRHIS